LHLGQLLQQLLLLWLHAPVQQACEPCCVELGYWAAAAPCAGAQRPLLALELLLLVAAWLPPLHLRLWLHVLLQQRWLLCGRCRRLTRCHQRVLQQLLQQGGQG
jgi:hypothetical protein